MQEEAEESKLLLLETFSLFFFLFFFFSQERVLEELALLKMFISLTLVKCDIFSELLNAGWGAIPPLNFTFLVDFLVLFLWGFRYVI